jgi:hypothetical protein
MSDQINTISGVAFSGDSKMYISQDGFSLLCTNQVSDIEFVNREGFKEFNTEKKGYSIIEGCIRQTMDLPIENSGQH